MKALEGAALKALLGGTALVLLALWVQGGFLPFEQFHRSAPVVWIKSITYWPIVVTVRNTLFNPLFWGFLGAILILERLFPAQRGQRIFSVGLAQDVVWFLLQPVLINVIHKTVVRSLVGVHRGYLAFFTIRAVGILPTWILLVWSILLVDFLQWFHHWVRHKVPVFWEFHTVHHAQRQLNLFTDLRYHIVEYVITQTIITLPLLMFTTDTSKIFAISLFLTWYTRVYHANIRTDFGPLRYILVTPQSHRIHHSIEPQHQDKNFGVIFCFWDRMFGTQYRGWDEYPETGIADESFPNETTVRGLELLRTPIRQHLYPFLALYRKMWPGYSPVGQGVGATVVGAAEDWR
jgi:sterol desaturase/sphingolipid hydroxylase (fatty acid hydroxylase superfamily)